MARFENLHDAGLALAGYLRRNLTPTLDDVLAAPPQENPSTATESIRLTLMWVTPQPTHRNDPWVTDDGGQAQPPPVALSGFYLVTAYGTAATGEPSQAINRLGQAIQIFETGPVIDLPLPDDPVTPGLDPTPGEGRLTVTHLPTAADLMEKIYTPLQMRHRPWALFEVGPIQLARLDTPRSGPDVVRPGGVRLAGPAPIAPPRILRATPGRLRPGGRVRLDTAEAASATGLRIGAESFAIVPAPAAPDEIAGPDIGGRMFAVYPATGAEGDVDALLRGPSSGSDPEPLAIMPADSAGVDAPAAPLASGADLVLTGDGLAATDRAYLWPDVGIADPGQVIDLAPDSATATSVTLARAALDGAGLAPGLWRASLLLTTGAFTPYVLVEVAP